MILAKKENGKEQSLFEHSKEVFDKLKEIFNLEINKVNLIEILNQCYGEEIESSFQEDDLNKVLFSLAFLHDLGKASPFFQKFLKKEKGDLEFNEEEKSKKSTKKNPFVRHNKLSYILSKSFEFKNKTNKDFLLKEILDFAILYHHSNYLYEKKCGGERLCEFLPKEKDLNQTLNLIKEYIFQLQEINLIENYFNLQEVEKNLNLFFFNKKLSSQTFPLFKSYSEISNLNSIKENSIKHFFRLFFTKADRDINNIDKLVEEKNIDFSLLDDKSFFPLNKKTLKQNEAVLEIVKNFSKSNVLILDGAAGCGKTRIFTKVYSKLKNKRMIVITPRNTISLGLYHDFLNKNYVVSEDFSFEIVNSEDRKKCQYNKESNSFIELDIKNDKELYQSDIIFMSLDHLITIYNQNSNRFFKILDGFLVFDEFHEIYEQPFLTIQFIELLYVLNNFKKSKVLLASGTINYALTKTLLDFIEKKNIIKVQSFNETEFSFNEIEESKKIKIVEEKLFKNQSISLIFNTAIQSQIETICFLKNLKKNIEINEIINIHSKFTKKDRMVLFEKLLKVFGRKNQINNKNILFAGPLVQASLNISTQNQITELTSPENLLQRIGRLNRFGEYQEDVNFYIFNNDLKIPSTWLKFFDLIKEEKVLTNNKIKELYDNFNDMLLTNKNLNTYLQKEIEENIFKKGFEIYSLLEKHLEPVVIINKNPLEEESKLKIKQFNLRGKSGVFVKPDFFELNLKENKFSEQNKYDKEIMNLSLDNGGGFNLVKNYVENGFDLDFNNEFNKIFSFKNKTVKETQKTNYLNKKYNNLFEQVKYVSTLKPLKSNFEKIEDLNKSIISKDICLSFEKKDSFEQFVYLKIKKEKNTINLGLMKIKSLLPLFQ